MNKVVSGTLAFAAGAALALAVPAEANADPAFGAMAYSPSKNNAVWGTGPTRQAAQDAAYNQCSANTDDCVWAAWTNGGCAAVVLGGPPGWGGGSGPTTDAAIQSANQNMGGAPGQVLSVQCVQGA
jgi:Domain of unknown function (DUF4189)